MLFLSASLKTASKQGSAYDATLITITKAQEEVARVKWTTFSSVCRVPKIFRYLDSDCLSISYTGPDNTGWEGIVPRWFPIAPMISTWKHEETR